MSEEVEHRRGPALDRMAGNIINSAVGNALVAAGLDPQTASALAGIAGPMAEETSYIARRLVKRRSERLRRFFESSAGQDLTVEELLNEVMDDDLKLELFARAVDAATKAISETKLDMLAWAFATGALAADGATVDESILVVESLGQLEAAHFRVLWLLRQEGPVHFDCAGTQIEGEAAEELKHAWTDEELAIRDPGVASVVTALTARLNFLGMLHDMSRSRLGIDVPLWQLTPFGSACASELKARGWSVS